MIDTWYAVVPPWKGGPVDPDYRMNVQMGAGPAGLGAALLASLRALRAHGCSELCSARGGARHRHRSPEAVPAVPAESPGVMHSAYVDCLCLLAITSMIVFPFPASHNSRASR